MVGDRPARLLPWVGGRLVEVAHFDPVVEPWAEQEVAQVGVADPGTVAAALDAAAAARSQMAAIRRTNAPAFSGPRRTVAARTTIWPGRSPRRPAK